ncbi:hypothetical protein CRG98_000610 [Punica granatum]|uniref:Uncharacterized protein n=1 Tax=Punica granatum TaxID=22663 RepID=A0A2I0LE79_PUNGR|nr:hypothetical protein CRG98_000610 [Punica granatum]
MNIVDEKNIVVSVNGISYGTVVCDSSEPNIWKVLGGPRRLSRHHWISSSKDVRQRVLGIPQERVRCSGVVDDLAPAVVASGRATTA